MNFATS